MNTRQGVERGALGLASLICGVAFTVLVIVSAGGGARGGTWLVAGLWGTGLATLLCAFAACRIDDDDDPADDPEYLVSLAHGLRSEWQRGRRAS